MVHLKRQLAARLDHDALDLEALAPVDTVIPAPGSIHLAVHHTLGVTITFKTINDFFHILGVALIGHKHRVGCFHDDQTLHTHACQETSG